MGVCDKALPAADFDVFDVRLSLSVFDAAVAARVDVCLGGAFLCESALPPAVFELAPVDLLVKVFDAALAAEFDVTLMFLII